MVCRSWRMLPGQFCDLSHSIGPRRDRLDVGAIGLVGQPQEVIGQPRDVAAAVAQRRQVDVDQVQAIQQVFAELAALHHLVQRAVRRRDHAHVDGARPARAEHFERAVLQHAQQLDLRRRIELADLVEEDRSAVGESRSVRAGPAARR